jgi:hypothetical protein
MRDCEKISRSAQVNNLFLAKLEGKNDPQKYKKYKKLRNFMFSNAGCSLRSAEGFCCCLDGFNGA